MRDGIEWQAARLRSVRDLAADIRLFEIEPAGPVAAPAPGSHINVAVLIGERPDTRCYSIVGPCTDGLYRIAVKLLPDSRGGSAYMWSLAPGAQLTISTPGNHFVLTPGRPDYLLVAGGIGITPIYTMALALAASGAGFRLLYACRRREDLALAEELRERIGERLEIFSMRKARGSISPPPSRGSLQAVSSTPADPIGMLDAVRRAWQRSGRPIEGCASRPSAIPAATPPRPSR